MKDTLAFFLVVTLGVLAYDDFHLRQTVKEMKARELQLQNQIMDLSQAAREQSAPPGSTPAQKADWFEQRQQRPNPLDAPAMPAGGGGGHSKGSGGGGPGGGRPGGPGR